jgi:hypothetical protein
MELVLSKALLALIFATGGVLYLTFFALLAYLILALQSRLDHHRSLPHTPSMVLLDGSERANACGRQSINEHSGAQVQENKYGPRKVIVHGRAVGFVQEIASARID